MIASTDTSLRLRRLRDGAALLFAGLSPRSRIVTPLVPDHRYQMALSRYLFACRFAQRGSVLDFGCGTGFGAPVLLQAKASSVTGVERYERPIRHANRRYGNDRADFRVGSAAAPSGELGLHGLVLAFDILGSHTNAETVLQRMAGHVDEGGVLVAGVALVGSRADILDAKAHGAATALYPWYWAAFFDELFEEVRYFRHCGPNAILDWREPSPSEFSATDFRFEEEESAEALRRRAGLSAVFVASRPRSKQARS